MKKAIIGIVAAAAAVIIIANAPKLKEEITSAFEEKTFSIKLVGDQVEDAVFEPGAEIPIHARVKNTGNESAYVFLKVDIPTVEGASLQDGETTTPAVLFEPGEGWEEIEDGVYFYEELLREGEETTSLIDYWIIPDYNLSHKDGELMTGSITAEEACEKASQASVHAYGIMEMKGTPEELWHRIFY